MNPLPLLALGLVLGLRHAADPDHVVAVTAITARTRRVTPAALLGAVWGLGHTLTLFVVGAAIIVFNWVVPPRVGLALEFVVAVALVTVGLWNLRGRHDHEEAGLGEGSGRPPTGRAFAVGMAHGLAGSAAVALLVLATVHDPRWACGYLLVFGFGTLLGMMVVTTGLAFPLSAVTRRWGGSARVLRYATGALSLLFGAWLIYQIGWREGLFLAVPHWTPR
jgi:high-affinity nickel-transport protein